MAYIIHVHCHKHSILQLRMIETCKYSSWKSRLCLWLMKEVRYKVHPQELYDIGKNNKKAKYSAEKAEDVLVECIVSDKWDLQIDATV
eukprot:1134812-Ditylum_brightwellii.AAC.1